MPPFILRIVPADEDQRFPHHMFVVPSPPRPGLEHPHSIDPAVQARADSIYDRCAADGTLSGLREAIDQAFPCGWRCTCDQVKAVLFGRLLADEIYDEDVASQSAASAQPA